MPDEPTFFSIYPEEFECLEFFVSEGPRDLDRAIRLIYQEIENVKKSIQDLEDRTHG